MLGVVRQPYEDCYGCSAEQWAWPLLQSLTLNDLLFCNAPFQQFKGKWPLLQSLSVYTHDTSDIAQVTALTEIDWPCLQTLCIDPSHDAISALTKGNWPELTDLSIGSFTSPGELERLADLIAMVHAAAIADPLWHSQSKWHVQPYPRAPPPTSRAVFYVYGLVHTE